MKNSMGETPLDLADSQERYQEAIQREGADGDPEKLRSRGPENRQRRTASRSCSGAGERESNKTMNDRPYVSRRSFLAAASARLCSKHASGGAAPLPIIDTHLHLYDPTRPQGAPFPKTPNPPPFLPRDYREAATPLGITGGIVVEASPWMEDNLWVLMTIEKEPMIVGLVGCLDPTKPDFREYLDRYHRNKLFLGIRYGNVWEGHNIVAAVESAGFIENMKAFAQTGLTFEVANPRFDLIEATVRLTDKVPDLRVVLDISRRFRCLPTRR